MTATGGAGKHSPRLSSCPDTEPDVDKAADAKAAPTPRNKQRILILNKGDES